MLIGLLRHGVAHDAGPDTDWQDEPRQLTDEGRSRMRAAAAGIARLDLGFDALVTSPLVRCAQTAEIVGASLGLEPRSDARLRPGLQLGGVLGLLVECPEADAVLLCGHQPDLSDVTAELIRGGSIAFKKGALALLELDDLRPGGATLVAHYPPATLRRLGGAAIG